MRALVGFLVKRQARKLQGDLQESQIKTMICCFKVLRITKPWQIWKKSPWAFGLVPESNIITSGILPHLCGLKGFISEHQCYLQPHKQSLEREVFFWPCKGLCLGLEEHLLSFELSEGDTRSGGACCEMQALSSSAAPGSHCGLVHETRGCFPCQTEVLHPPPLASETSYPRICLGTGSAARATSPAGPGAPRGARRPTAGRASLGSCVCREANRR